MKIIVYDIEATCWDGNPTGMVQETIEIGACELNQYGETVSYFSRLIRPVLHPSLSHFCRKLTNIDQVDVNRAKDFPRVIDDFLDWINVDYDDYLLAAWGRFDKRQLTADCRLHRVDDYWLEPSIDLKAQYQEIKGLPKKRGLKAAVRHEGFEWEGEQHRALVDAKHTALIFQSMIDMWRY